MVLSLKLIKPYYKFWKQSVECMQNIINKWLKQLKWKYPSIIFLSSFDFFKTYYFYWNLFKVSIQVSYLEISVQFKSKQHYISTAYEMTYTHNCLLTRIRPVVVCPEINSPAQSLASVIQPVSGSDVFMFGLWSPLSAFDAPHFSGKQFFLLQNSSATMR